jgi:hypothetical protein
MNRAWFALLAALVVGAGFAWVLLSGDHPAVDDGDAPRIERAPPATSPPPSDLPPVSPGSLAGGGEETRPKPKPVEPEGPVRIPMGGLYVTPIQPDGKPWLPSEARVFVEPVREGLWAVPTGVPDAQSGTWRFDRIPAGPVRIRVGGDHVVDAYDEVTVLAGQTKELTLTADRGGAVAYKVVLYSGEEPPEVTLTLLDVDRKPVPVWWQVRKTNMLTTPRRLASVTQAAQGVAFGVRPGRYTLRAKSPAEEFDEAEVEVKPGETVEAEIRLRG